MKLLSLNVWFDYQYRKERTLGLCNYIKKNKPDLVALQEVTKQVAENIKKELESIYFISELWDIGNSSYGTLSLAIKSKNKSKIFDTLEFERIQFPNSTMNRDILLTKTPEFIMINTHLESMDTHTVRESQLNFIQNIIKTRYKSSMGGPSSDKSIYRIIVAGDFNFDATKNHPNSSFVGLENDSIEKCTSMKDVWKMIHQEYDIMNPDPGYTFDTTTNSNLSRSLFDDKSRYDRILVGEGVNPINIFILDVSINYMSNKIPLSDHYGLVMEFDIKKCHCGHYINFGKECGQCINDNYIMDEMV